MSLLDIVFVALVLFFAWRGYVKGFWDSVSRLLGWALAYPSSILLTRPGGDWLSLHTPLTGLLAYFIAGSVIFLLTSFVASLAFKWLGEKIPASDTSERLSKYSGLSLGLVFGGLLGLLVVYALNLLPQSSVIVTAVAKQTQNPPASTPVSAQPKSPVPSLGQLQQKRDSFIAASAKKLISSAAAEAVSLTLKDETAAQVTRAFVADPQTMLGHVQALNQDGEIKALLQNPGIQKLLSREDSQGLIDSAEFKTLVSNPHMQALMQEADVRSEQGERAAAEKLIAAWNRTQQLKYDPRVTTILQDREFQQQLNNPNKLALMMNPKLKQLTEIIFNPAEHYAIRDLDSAERASLESNSSEATDGSKKAPTRIYRWTDESGQVHYSDKPGAD